MNPFALDPYDQDDDNQWRGYPDRDAPADWEADVWMDADEFLAEHTAAALQQDPRVHGRYLELAVQNRVVILIGEVGSEDAKQAATERVWSIPGVFDVNNRLIVTGSGTRRGGRW
jgi:hypothetical protein